MTQIKFKIILKKNNKIEVNTNVVECRQALLCILADNCDEPMYKKLVTALCQVKHLVDQMWNVVLLRRSTGSH